LHGPTPSAARKYGLFCRRFQGFAGWAILEETNEPYESLRGNRLKHQQTFLPEPMKFPCLLPLGKANKQGILYTV